MVCWMSIEWRIALISLGSSGCNYQSLFWVLTKCVWISRVVVVLVG